MKSIPVLLLENCIAKRTSDDKPGLSVMDHSVYVAIIAKELVKRLPKSLQSLFERSISLIACHDVGKVSPGFQRKIYGDDLRRLFPDVAAKLTGDGFKSLHAEISEAALQNKTHGKWAQVVGMHHGMRSRELYAADKEIYGGPDWQNERTKLIDLLVERFGPLPTGKPQEHEIELVAGLTVVADWIASDEDFFPAEGLPKETDLEEKAKQVLDELDWNLPTANEEISFQQLFDLKDETPNEIQSIFRQASVKPGVYVLEAPMGIGKTEAALWSAYSLIEAGRHSGIYFALPTRTTSDKIHERIEPFVDKAFSSKVYVRLQHGTAWMRPFLRRIENSKQKGKEEETGNNTWFSPSKRGLLLPFGVGTIDQTLLGVLNAKHWFLRLFGLAGKVIILDEVHSYDMYTGTLLDTLVNKLRELDSTVIILSATLTKSRRNALFTNKTETESSDDTSNDPYPMLTYRYNDSDEVHSVSFPSPPSKPVELEHWDWDIDRVAQHALERGEQGEIVLCIMNTVDRAQELYCQILGGSTENLPTDRIGLLHSRFPVWRREELDKDWLDLLGKRGDRSKGAVLVATQVVEQSVDIDADLLLTELAPTDMMLQRLGRLWRHERNDRQKGAKRKAIILHPVFGKTDEFEKALGSNAFVYDPYVLWCSRREWIKRKSVSIPDGIRELLEATYVSPGDNEEDCVLKMYDISCKKRKKLRGLANAEMNTTLPTDLFGDERSCMTRYNTKKSLDILLVKEPVLLVKEPGGKKGKVFSLVLASGDPVVLELRNMNKETAVVLHRNLLSITHRTEYDDWAQFGVKEQHLIQEYFFEPVVPLWIDEETGRLKKLTGESTPLYYRADLGVYREQALRQTAMTDDSYLNNEDVENYIDESEW